MICCNIFGMIYDTVNLNTRFEIDITNLSTIEIKSKLKVLINSFKWTMPTESIISSIDNNLVIYHKGKIKDKPLVEKKIIKDIKKTINKSNQLSLFD